MKRVMTVMMGWEWGYVMLITSLCQCDSVVLQKDDFQAVSDHRIVVDHLADGCDQADNHFGCVVSRGSLHERTEGASTKHWSGNFNLSCEGEFLR